MKKIREIVQEVREKRLEKELAKNQINPNKAYCTECHGWYDTTDQAAVNLHAH